MLQSSGAICLPLFPFFQNRYVKRISALWRLGITPGDMAPAGALAAGLAPTERLAVDVIGHMASVIADNGCPTAVFDRLRQSMLVYNETLPAIAGNPCVPTMFTDHVEYRAFNVGFVPIITLMLSGAVGEVLTTAGAGNPELGSKKLAEFVSSRWFHEVTFLASSVGGLMNDTFSFPKDYKRFSQAAAATAAAEILTDDVPAAEPNSVIVLRQQLMSQGQDASVWQCRELAVGHMEQLVCKLDQLMQPSQLQGEPLKALMRQVVIDFMIGTHRWHAECGRYDYSGSDWLAGCV